MKECLFAYGTLLPDRAPAAMADVIQRLERVGRGSMRGWLYDLGEFPGAIVDDKAPREIWGEVFRLPKDDLLLRRLDDYEGFDAADPGGSLFVRRRSSVMLTSGERLNCWVYVYNRTPPAGSLLPGGDYRVSAVERKRQG